MKKNIFLISFTCLLISLWACKKEGQIITDPSFGILNISGTLSNPLFVQIDGKLIDTIKPGENFTTPVAEGDHSIALLDSTKKTVTDTVLAFEKKKITNLSNFFYTGTGVLFPDIDTTKAPPPGKAWVRFVITDKTLPDELNLEISFYDFNTGIRTPIGKVNGVKKNQFSTYIELSNSSSPDELYIIDGTDLNGHKVLSIDDFSSGYISFDFDLNIGTVFVPNSIISMGIGAIPDDGVSTFHNPEVIFKRIAK